MAIYSIITSHIFRDDIDLSNSIEMQVNHLREHIARLQDKGLLKAAIDIANQVLNLTRQYWGKYNIEFIRSLDKMIELLDKSGKYDKAEKYAMQILLIRRKLVGQQHLDFALAVYILALLIGYAQT
jgi:hypothetical protein